MFALEFYESEILKAKGKYRCGDDDYEAVYTFNDADTFTVYYLCVGPDKDYVIETEFIRNTQPNETPL